MADLVKPELPEFYSPGRTFLSAFAMGAAINARKQQLENQLQQMALRNQAVEQGIELKRAAFDQTYSLKQQEFGLKQEQLQNLMEHQSQAVDLSKRSQDLREQELALSEQKAAKAIEDQKIRVSAQRQGLFNQTLKQYGIPVDALEDTSMWKKDKDGKLALELPIRDAHGAQLYSGVEKTVDPVTKQPVPKPLSVVKRIDPETLDYLKTLHKDIRDSSPTPAEVPAPETKVLDAGTAKNFLQQAGGDKAKARQMALDAGYTF